MTLKSIAARLLPARSLRWLKRMAGRQDMADRLANMKRAGLICRGVVDAGAYQGEWSRLALELFRCPVLAIEPQPRPDLEQLEATGQVVLERVALGDVAAESASFLRQGSNSRLPNEQDLALADADDIASVPVARLDQVLDRHPDFTPTLLKLDLQGAELRALAGAGRYLADIEVIVCEVSLIPIGGVPILDEIMQFMTEHRFRLYDFLPAYYRPLDGALWQADALFVHADSKLLSSTRWGP